tara:strand:+ start:1964 stop:2395 length:432 start_codon:yes stop_codon:yes gene_type:complete
MEAEKKPEQVIASLLNPGTEVYSLMVHPNGSVTITLGVRDQGYSFNDKTQLDVVGELHEELKACGFEFKAHTTWVETPSGDVGYSIPEWTALSDEERLPMDISRWGSYYEKWTECNDPRAPWHSTCVYLFVIYNNLDRPNKKS